MFDSKKMSNKETLEGRLWCQSETSRIANEMMAATRVMDEKLTKARREVQRLESEIRLMKAPFFAERQEIQAKYRNLQKIQDIIDMVRGWKGNLARPGVQKRDFETIFEPIMKDDIWYDLETCESGRYNNLLYPDLVFADKPNTGKPMITATTRILHMRVLYDHILRHSEVADILVAVNKMLDDFIN